MKYTRVNNKDDIDLIALFHIIWFRKFYIIGFVFICSLMTVFLVLRIDNIYQSKLLLKPIQNNSNNLSNMMPEFGGLASLVGVDLNQGSVVKPFSIMNNIIKNGYFLADFVRKNGYEKHIIEDYDEKMKNKKFAESKNFLINKATMEMVNFEEDSKSGVIVLSFKNKDREFTKTFLEKLIAAISNKYETLELTNIQQQIDNYKEEIDKSSDMVLKNRLSVLVSGLIQNKILSQANEYYGFNILVKPAVPDKLDKVYPRRSLICIAAFLLSFAVSCTASLLLDIFCRNNQVR